MELLTKKVKEKILDKEVRQKYSERRPKVAFLLPAQDLNNSVKFGIVLVFDPFSKLGFTTITACTAC